MEGRRQELAANGGGSVCPTEKPVFAKLSFDASRYRDLQPPKRRGLPRRPARWLEPRRIFPQPQLFAAPVVRLSRANGRRDLVGANARDHGLSRRKFRGVLQQSPPLAA